MKERDKNISTKEKRVYTIYQHTETVSKKDRKSVKKK